MAVGDVLFLRLSIREGIAKGAGLGAASHGAGTARSYEIGPQEGVVASLVMMLSGVVMVLAAPAGEMGHVLKSFLLLNSYSLRFFLYLTTIHI